MTALIPWKTRCRRRSTHVADVRSWESRCGRYRVEQFTSRFIRDGRGRYEVVWYAVHVAENGLTELIVANKVNRHYRSRRAAERACAKHAEGTRRKPRRPR